jgi:LPLT family lysophospholipid transporter-like MFS transporter
MNRGLLALLISQFFSAFADNAILFIVIAMVIKAGQTGSWYVPALQSAFLVAFVLLAPWVGRFADAYSKPRVLLAGNLLKAIGIGMIMLKVDALVAYAVIGAGAAIFGPAKYGVLPEMVGHEQLVKANGWVEGSTIFAIILGTVLGAKLADWNIQWALVMVLLTYIISIFVIFFMPRLPARGVEAGRALPNYMHMMRGFFVTSRARFSMLGASLFWGASAVLRVLIVAWAPVVLMTKDATDIAALTLYLAVGIIIGAALVPRLIPIEYLRRARLAAYAMSIFIIVLGFIGTPLLAKGVLFFIGLAGGLFVVPVNAALQEIGHKSIGSGGAVAIQQFFENLAMLLAVGLYTLATAEGAPPVPTMFVLGILVLIATFVVSWHLPPDPNKVDAETVESITEKIK